MATGKINRAIQCKGQYIPLPDARFCGGGALTDSDYIDSANRDATRLVRECDITKESTVLDIGCGSGRLAIGLLNVCPGLHKYWGMDVHTSSIQWCLRWITRYHPNFQFCCVSLRNDRYNAGGTRVGSDIQLPFKDGLFDVVFLVSVFTHMVRRHLVKYIEEIHRLLKPGGKAMFTIYVGEASALDQSGGRLFRVVHTDRFLRGALAAAGFRVLKVQACAGEELAGQTAVLIERRPQ